MDAVRTPIESLTVNDIMTRGVTTVRASQQLRDAAKKLARAHVHGAPVVDGDGRCVGVLSVTDLARHLAEPDDHSMLQACSYQKSHRDSTGGEWVECTLGIGSCALQREDHGQVTCADPRGFCTDWQVIHLDTLPADEVRRYMTTEVVTASPGQPVREVARIMLDRAVRRVVVLDADRRPVGIVSAMDVLRFVAGVGGGR